MTLPVFLGLFPSLEVNTYQELQLLDPRRVSISITFGLSCGIGHTLAGRKSYL